MGGDPTGGARGVRVGGLRAPPGATLVAGSSLRALRGAVLTAGAFNAKTLSKPVAGKTSYFSRAENYDVFIGRCLESGAGPAATLGPRIASPTARYQRGRRRSAL